MRTQRAGRPGGQVGRVGQVAGGSGGFMMRKFRNAAFLLAFFLPALPGLPVLPGLPGLAAAQVTFERATADLASPDAPTRLRAARMLKETAYPEAASPLARLLADPQDDVQLEAIAGELNIFLAEKIAARKRIGLVIEKRNSISAEPAFAGGPLVLGARPVPLDVLTALRAAARDDNPRVGLEALYAFGALAVEPAGPDRRELLRASGPDLAAMIGAQDPAFRFAALRVMGRLFERRAGDDPVQEEVGDAVIIALNDSDRTVRGVAMHALGSMRYDRAARALIDLFQYLGKGERAEAALDALARIAHPSTAVVFTLQLASKSPAIKAIAVEGLARMRDPAVFAAVDGALVGERNEGVVLAGRFAAVMLSGAPVDPIVEALAKPRFRERALQYLVELAPGRSAVLARQVQDPNPRLRADVIDALGLAGDPAALGAIDPMVKDPDPQVARAAERAVARLRRPGT